MKFNPKHPSALLQIQKEFASVAMTPFSFGEEVVCQPHLYAPQLVKEILSVKNLSGSMRIQVYNQQYWFRLFTILQTEYALLAYLLGYKEFNRMVSDYLSHYPSRFYSLNRLSDNLSLFVSKSEEWSVPEIVEVVALEAAYIKAFDASESQDFLGNSPLSSKELKIIEEVGVGFQASCFLFHEKFNGVELRKEVKKIKNHEELDANLIPRESYWCIYRQHHRVYEEPLTAIQFQLLTYLKAGASLTFAIEQLETLCSEQELQQIEGGISAWFRHWVTLEWFTLPNQGK